MECEMSEEKKTIENKEYDIKTMDQNKSIWIRLLFILLFCLLYSVAEFVIIAVVVYQFLHVLLTGGSKDEKIANFGLQLSTYVYQILQFQTFNTETKPYPMSDWPSEKRLVEEAEKPKRAPRKRAPARRKTPAKPATKKPTTTKTTDDKPAEEAPKAE